MNSKNKMLQEKQARVCIGAFAGAHGVRGEAKVKTFTADPRAIADYGSVDSEDKKRSFTLKLIRSLKPELVLVSSPEIVSREDAAALAGTRLYVPRDRLEPPEEDEFYYADLVGLAVRVPDGELVGKIAAVHNFGAGDIIEMREIPNHKGSHLVPFTTKAVPDIYVKNGYIVLHPDYLPSVSGDDEEQKG